MDTARLVASSERFGALYRRWDGAIPLDDLGPYLEWYRQLPADERRAFRLCVMFAILGGAPHRASHVLHVLRQIAEWFPV